MFNGIFWHRQFSAEDIIFSVKNFVVVIIIIAIIIIITVVIIIFCFLRIKFLLYLLEITVVAFNHTLTGSENQSRFAKVKHLICIITLPYNLVVTYFT